MGHSLGSDEFRDRGMQEARQSDALPINSPFERLANQPLNPQLEEKIGKIRRIRRWLTRDLTSLAVGVSASILLGCLFVAAALWEEKPLPLDGLADYAIAVWAVFACGVFTGFFLILGCFLVEHLEFLRRCRFAYVVALLVWAAFCALIWQERSTEMTRNGRPPPGLDDFCRMGFATLPLATFAACIPLLGIGAITSLFMRRTKGPPSGSLLTHKSADCSTKLATERRIDDEFFTNQPGPCDNPG
jgi:hypothetical protein